MPNYKSYITVIFGEKAGTKIELGDYEITIGRDEDCEIVFEDKSVSRRHAKILQKNGIYYIRDNNSRNGVELNSKKIVSDMPLRNNDEIKLGNIILKFEEELLIPKEQETINDTIESRAKTDASKYSVDSEKTAISHIDPKDLIKKKVDTPIPEIDEEKTVMKPVNKDLIDKKVEIKPAVEKPTPTPQITQKPQISTDKASEQKVSVPIFKKPIFRIVAIVVIVGGFLLGIFSDKIFKPSHRGRSNVFDGKATPGTNADTTKIMDAKLIRYNPKDDTVFANNKNFKFARQHYEVGNKYYAEKKLAEENLYYAILEWKTALESVSKVQPPPKLQSVLSSKIAIAENELNIRIEDYKRKAYISFKQKNTSVSRAYLIKIMESIPDPENKWYKWAKRRLVNMGGVEKKK